MDLHRELKQQIYRHAGYQAFKINDPKPREIHKASVRDQLLHHAIYRILYPFFDHTFIADSFSCRLDKGTHKALNRFSAMAYQVSNNHHRTCWVLKLDVRKFFANIDHAILKQQLSRRIADPDVLWLLHEIIISFASSPGVGLPLGNLTSQLLVNIYMNDFDQNVKHQLKARYYIRYADDMLILSENREHLHELLPKIKRYLWQHLRLNLHPDKTFIQTIASGVDFLGWVHFPDHRVLRTKTKQRMMRRLEENPSTQSIQSYLGLLSHGNTYTLNRLVRSVL